MPQPPTPCKCPSCGASISLEHLKANLTDEALKALWASLGGRNRKGRKISPEQQAAMQVTRATNRLIRRFDAQKEFFVDVGIHALLVIEKSSGRSAAVVTRPPERPTPAEAEAFVERVKKAIKSLSNDATA